MKQVDTTGMLTVARVYARRRYEIRYFELCADTPPHKRETQPVSARPSFSQ